MKVMNGRKGKQMTANLPIATSLSKAVLERAIEEKQQELDEALKAQQKAADELREALVAYVTAMDRIIREMGNE